MPASQIAVTVLLLLVVWSAAIGFVVIADLRPFFRDLILWGASLLTLLIVLQYFIAFMNYYLDVWVVTTKRVLEIEQHGLFNREYSEFTLDRVQDVSIETKGMLSTFLKFADIHIQTAGTNRDFYFRQVPHADQAKDAILQECDHYMCSLRGEPDRHHDDVPRSGL